MNVQRLCIKEFFFTQFSETSGRFAAGLEFYHNGCPGLSFVRLVGLLEWGLRSTWVSLQCCRWFCDGILISCVFQGCFYTTCGVIHDSCYLPGHSCLHLLLPIVLYDEPQCPDYYLAQWWKNGQLFLAGFTNI